MICARRCIARTNGRPAIDPEILFRMLLVGYLHGIKSEARLEEEINYNIAYKWFCGLDLTDKAPDATTISQNRRRRFRDNNIAEEIFNEILRQLRGEGAGGRSDPVYGFDAHQGESEQAQEEAGGSSGHAEGISE